MATITVTPGHTYGPTNTVTSTNLNNLGSPTAALTAGSILTADIADANVTTAKIADSNVTTAKIADANVTFAKLTDVIDDDTMATASDTTLATSESIKAYVDNVSVFTKSFESAEQDVPAANAAVLTISHSLGEIPKLTEVVYRCKTNDNGWIAGDEIVSYSQSDSGLGDWAVVKNSAEVKFRGVYSQRRFAHGTSSNAVFFPASPNWKIVFRAYA
jgi:hypothetical protein